MDDEVSKSREVIVEVEWSGGMTPENYDALATLLFGPVLSKQASDAVRRRTE